MTWNPEGSGNRVLNWNPEGSGAHGGYPDGLLNTGRYGTRPAPGVWDPGGHGWPGSTPDRPYDTVNTPDIYGAMAALVAANPALGPAPDPAPAQDSTPNGSSGGDGGYGAALNSINTQYQTSLDRLNSNRDLANKNIAGAYTATQDQQRTSNDAYRQDAERFNSQLATRIAQQIADSHAAAQRDAQFANSFGLNGAAIAANGANIDRTTQNVAQYGRDLMAALQQIQRGSQLNYANAAGLVNQGAVGRLNTNYTASLDALNKSRDDAVAKAQAAAASAAARASSGGSSSKQLRETKAAAQLWFMQNVDPSTRATYYAWKNNPVQLSDPTQMQLYGNMLAAGV